jgi:hypothetical protein
MWFGVFAGQTMPKEILTLLKKAFQNRSLLKIKAAAMQVPQDTAFGGTAICGAVMKFYVACSLGYIIFIRFRSFAVALAVANNLVIFANDIVLFR